MDIILLVSRRLFHFYRRGAAEKALADTVAFLKKSFAAVR